MAYDKLVHNISIAIESQFKEISARYNFDYGDEFELAICELLLKILPDQYGVCRGFIVTEKDEFGGDDIIIYDKNRFPTLRLLDKNDFNKKQEVPIEAVYSYLEAKHTIFLSNIDNGQSFAKAFTQVGKIKALPREKRSLLALDPYANLGAGFRATRKEWPNYTNPIFGGIISRQVKENPKGKELNSSEIFQALKELIIPPDSVYPDMIVLGQTDIMFPAIPDENTEDNVVFNSPFYVEGKSTLVIKQTKTSSLAVGVIMLLYALDTIKLDTMPYKKIIMSQMV